MISNKGFDAIICCDRCEKELAIGPYPADAEDNLPTDAVLITHDGEKSNEHYCGECKQARDEEEMDGLILAVIRWTVDQHVTRAGKYWGKDYSNIAYDDEGIVREYLKAIKNPGAGDCREGADHIHVSLPSGAVASVSPNASTELLGAMDKMVELAKGMPDANPGEIKFAAGTAKSLTVQLAERDLKIDQLQDLLSNKEKELMSVILKLQDNLVDKEGQIQDYRIALETIAGRRGNKPQFFEQMSMIDIAAEVLDKYAPKKSADGK